ncbi:MAG: DUF892 family protein [Chloroflexota bacterium]
MRTIAERVGQPQAARLLNETLDEESQADKLLTEAAQPLYEEAA